MTLSVALVGGITLEATFLGIMSQLLKSVPKSTLGTSGLNMCYPMDNMYPLDAA
jgi:hypothetical protein